MPLPVEMNEAFNPVDIGSLGSQAVMLGADLVANLVEETRRRGGVHGCS